MRLPCFLVAVLAAAAAQAAFPERPVRLIVPYPAGGPNDILARMVGQKLGEAWRHQVVIDNRPGAGGNLAAELAARSTPDGYTIILPAIAYAVNPTLYSKVPYKLADFSPVSIVSKGPLVMVAHPSLGANSVKEFIALAKARPGQIHYGSGGNGSSLHLAAEMFKLAAGVNIVHVPYKGTNDFIPDLLAGRIPVVFSSPLVAQQHVKAGRLKALGVTSAKRSSGWPDTPSIAEAGVPGYEMDAWYAILAPAGTPKDIVQEISAQVAQGLKTPDVQEKLAAIGVEPVGSNPEQAAVYIANEAAKWSKVLRAANIRAD